MYRTARSSSLCNFLFLFSRRYCTNSIRVIPRQSITVSEEAIHYYCGGLSALMQACRKVENLQEGSKEKVIYTNDGGGLTKTQAELSDFQYHKKLSERIRRQQGAPVMIQERRAFWSTDFREISLKQSALSAFGISATFLNHKEIRKTTLLQEHSLHVLTHEVECKFLPGALERIVTYLQENHPYNFIHHRATLKELHIDQKTFAPLFVHEHSPEDGVCYFPITTFFCSPGHNRVFYDKSTPLWTKVVVTDLNSLWQCKIGREEMADRLEITDISREKIKQCISKFVPCHNLNHFQTTISDCDVTDNAIVLSVRVSDSNNLEITRKNLNKFFCGYWELISIDACTWKPLLSLIVNVPACVPVPEFNFFLNNSRRIDMNRF